MTTHLLKIIIQVTDKASAGFKQVEASTKKIDKTMGSINRRANRYLGIGFALLFQGMALQRVFSKFLTSAWTTYQKVIDVQDIFFKKTQELSAAWQFFKFSMIDALLQSNLMVGLIDFVMNIVKALGRLTPEAQAGLGAIFFWSMITFGALSILGAVILTVGSFAMALGVSFWGLAGGIATVFAWVGLLAGSFLILTSDVMTPLEKTILWVGTAITIFALKFMVAGFMVTSVTLLIGALIIVLTLLSVKFDGLGNAVKAMAATAIVALGFLADFIVKSLVLPIQWLAMGIAKVMELAGKAVPTWLEEFITWKPTIHVAAAELAARIQPEAVEETPMRAITSDIGNQIKEGFIGIAEEIGKSVGENMEDVIERKTTLLPSTEG